MNVRSFSEAMSKIDEKYIDEALSYERKNLPKKISRKVAGIAAAIIIGSGLCGSVAYEFGLFDPWLQKPADDPIETVRSAIEGQADKAYTTALRIEEIWIDEDETVRVQTMYSGSELALARGWTEEYLSNHFLVVWAKYYVEYDHTKTFLEDGHMEQYFYLIQDTASGEWAIADNTSPEVALE